MMRYQCVISPLKVNTIIESSHGKRLHASQVAHQARANPSFRSINQLGVFLLLAGWDARVNSPVPINTAGCAGWRAH